MKLQIDPYVLRVGFGCNNNCKFCFQETRKPLFKTAQSIEKELLEARLQHFSYVIFEGGEPTLRKDIFALIRYAKKLGFKQVDIQSNGRMFFYKKVCRRFIDAGVSVFACSLHAHNEKMHDFLTSSPGSFREAVQGIKNLKELGQQIANQAVISKVNYSLLPEITAFLIDLGIDRIQLNFIQPLGVAEKNFDLLVPHIPQILPYVKKALEIGIKAKIYIGTMGIPACLLGNYVEYSQEYKRAKAGASPDRVVYKRKGIVCKGCACYRICEGPWSSYVRYFGWKEFGPK